MTWDTRRPRKYNPVFCPLKPDGNENAGQMPSSGTLQNADD